LFSDDVVRVRSGGDRLHADALTQCLLCEGWLPGMAACLQHSLANHTDCGVFLCPRCQQDDFPGEFELIQHFQEHHCPDLELCEGSDVRTTKLVAGQGKIREFHFSLERNSPVRKSTLKEKGTLAKCSFLWRTVTRVTVI